MPIPEANVLRPADPSISNSNDWGVFVLTDASVVLESNGRPASLLAAYADTPLRIEGRLRGPGLGQAKYYVKKSYKPVHIELRDITRFSYGKTTDGAHVVRAQGKAGWFEIQPATHYQSLFDDMIQAVEILYFVTDINGDRREKGDGPSVQLIFQEYAEDVRFACSDPAIAEQVFDRHHEFLMMCFKSREQTIDWAGTPLYQYFRKRHPKTYEVCEARVMQCKFSESQSGCIRAASTRTDGIPKKDKNWWEATAIFEFMQKAVNQKVLRTGHNLITLQRVAELVVRRYEIEELETAQNVLLVHADNLCYIMDHPRRKNIQFFASEPIYQELTAGYSLSAADQRKVENLELKPRKAHAKLKSEGTESSDTSEEEDQDDIKTFIHRRSTRHNTGRLSVLRPRSSGQGQGRGSTGGKGNAPLLDHEALSDELEDEESETNSTSADEMMVDTPTEMLPPGCEKRKLEEIDGIEDGEGRRCKRGTSTNATPDSPPVSAGSDDDDMTVSMQGTSPDLPLRQKNSSNLPPGSRRPPPTIPPIAPSLVSNTLSTCPSHDLRDSWICSFDECSQRIHGCSNPTGQQLITEHLEDHARGRERVVGILWQEQDKLHLPVSNLIKKIREMSELSTPLFPTDAMAQPKSIGRPA